MSRERFSPRAAGYTALALAVIAAAIGAGFGLISLAIWLLKIAPRWVRLHLGWGAMTLMVGFGAFSLLQIVRDLYRTIKQDVDQ